jgi:hypothetical protein
MDSNSKQVFQNFTDATVALLDCEDAPEGVHEAVTTMVEYFANELNGTPDFDGDYARRVMSKVLGLRDEAD